MPSVSEALLRYGGMYGSAWRQDTLTREFAMLAEAVEVSGNAEVNRIEVPIVGATRNGYKPGRETREGTLRIQKVDAKWEHEIWQFMSAGIQQRRVWRDNPAARATAPSRAFALTIRYDDPDALGPETWELRGCQIWRLPMGFAITDDIVEREFPFTWETERPIAAFHAVRDAQGNPAPAWLTAVPSPATLAEPVRDF